MPRLFITGGTLIDPERRERIAADLLTENGVIRAILPRGSTPPEGAQVLPADGCFVTPGFIDPHGHIDGHTYTGKLSLLQGITTSVGGNCGFSRRVWPAVK